MKTCGDFGGITTKGTPCKIRGNRLCGLHQKEADMRTALLSDEQIAEVERLAELNCTHEEIAYILDVSPRTFANRLEDQDGVRAAYKRGVSKAHSEVKGQLREQIKAGNTTAIIFYLKTQCGWKDTQHVELTGRDGGPMEYRSLSPRERATRISDMLEQALSRN